MKRALEVFVRFLRLGLTSFGGPIAHLGFFRRELVERERWVTNAEYVELVGVCSVLPGPTSSQVGIALGARRAGPLGGLAAWLGFSLPTALALGAFGIAIRSASALAGPIARPIDGALEGLAGAAGAVVLVAVVGLARTLAITATARGIAVGAFALALALGRFAPGYAWLPLVLGGIAGGYLLRATAPMPKAPPRTTARSRRLATIAAGAFCALLLGLPIIAPVGGEVERFATFFRAGALVFGGGHVVLPFLQAVVGPDRVPARAFLAGYGAAQAMPGPLFCFAAFLGAADRTTVVPILSAVVAVVGIFAPSFLLLAAALPLWEAVREAPRAAAVLAGLGSAVVGLLAAAFVDPIATTLARDPLAAAIGIVALVPLWRFKAPAWAVVLGAAAAGALARTAIATHLAG